MESLFSPVASGSHAPLKAPDSPSAPAGPITDFALLESQKENIKPLASGRSAATLSSLFVAEKEEVDKAVMEGHEKHRKEIEEAERRDREGEDMVEGIQDVLDAHHRWVPPETKLMVAISYSPFSTTRHLSRTSCLFWNPQRDASFLTQGTLKTCGISSSGSCTLAMSSGVRKSGASWKPRISVHVTRSSMKNGQQLLKAWEGLCRFVIRTDKQEESS
jgi:hypothetical protein